MARFLTQENDIWVQLPAPPEITVSPAVLWLIVSIAAVFFVSGVLHILHKLFKKKHSYHPSISQSSRYSELHDAHSLGRQLQQLFRLQDSGLDQSFIDSLPVFHYNDIVLGPQDPFDCAMCLCEFLPDDKLRLIPICSHAFHSHCIDTWLLSNSTCPLCRVNLGLCKNNNDNHNGRGRENVISAPTSNIERVLSVRLGKLEESFNGEERSSNGGEGNRLDERRCFSMGSFRYVVNDKDLEVAFSGVIKKDEEDERKIKSESFLAKFPVSSSEIQVGHVSSSLPMTL